MKRRLLITFLLGCLLPFAVQAQHGTFRFAQITDIHFSPNNPNPTEDLLRSVAQINAIDSIDFVNYSGTQIVFRIAHYGVCIFCCRFDGIR